MGTSPISVISSTMGTSPISVISSSMMSTTTSSSISIASATTIVSLARERSIPRALNESNLLHDHLLGPVDTLRGTSDDEILLYSIRRCRLVNLSVGSAGLVDALDRLTTLANDQSDLAGGHHHIFGLFPFSSSASI